MSTVTATTSTVLFEVWVPAGAGAWELVESAHQHTDLVPNAGIINDPDCVLNACQDRRGPVVAEAVTLGERPCGSLPMVAVLPTYDRGELVSMLVMGFQSGDGWKVAVEVWSGAAGDFELHHEHGIYPDMERFARISKYVHFPWASGLPGRAWELAAPQLLTGIGESLAFLRSSGASDAGLDVGLSVPVIDNGHLRGVMVALGGGIPMFRGIEIYRPVDNQLERVESHGEAAHFLAAGERTRLAPGDGLAGRAWAARRAMVDATLEKPACRRGDAARSDGLLATAAIPIFLGEEVRAVLQLAI